MTLQPTMAEGGDVEVDAQFVQSAAAGVAYWQRRLRDTDDGSMAALSGERHNILLAIEFGLRLPQTLTAAATLTLQMFHMVRYSGQWREWTPIFEWAASLVADADGALERRLWNRVGQLYHAARRLDEAVAAHQRVAEEAGEAGDEEAQAQAFFHLAEDYREKRAYGRARRYAQEALQRFEALGSEKKWTAGAVNTLGMVAWRRGDLQQAEALFRQMGDLCRELQEPTELAHALNNLGGVLREQKSFAAARQAYEEARGVLQGTTNALDKVLVNVALGSLHYEQEQYEAAEEAFRAADTRTLRRSGLPYYQAYVANGLGNVFFRQGRPEAATARLRRAVALWREADDELMMANSMRGVARVLAAQGRAQEALAYYDQALGVAVRYEDDAWARELASGIREERERTAEAAQST